MNSLRTIILLLEPRERRRGLRLLLLIGFAALLDGLVVAAALPFLALIFSTDPNIRKGGIMDALSPLFQLIDAQPRISVGLFFIAAVILSGAVSYLSATLQTRFVHDVGHRLSTRLLDAYLAIPFDRLVRADVSRTTRNILAEANQFAQSALRPILQTVENGAILLAISVALLRVSPQIAVEIGLALGLLYTAFYLTRRRRLHDIGVRRLQANGRRHKIAAEAIGGIKEIKVAHAEREFARRFEAASREHARLTAESQAMQVGSQYILEALAVSSVVGAIILLSSGTRSASSIIPTLGIFAFGMFRMMPALHRLLANASQLRFFGPALTSMAEDLAISPLAEPTVAVRRLAFTKSLRLEEVTVRYPERPTPAIDAVSLEVIAGESIGLVGRTGAGKSTIADVILGLIHPTSGTFTVDGMAITADNRHAWQTNLGYVPQRIYLADDTVRANIAFGIPADQVEDANVRRAAEAAQIDEFLRTLPDGYETLVGERGVRLSGGQQQRIGIARALYKRPKVIVLDEATSDLDTTTEAKVVDAIHDIDRQATVIVIAHRPAAVRSCDRIYVVESGRIVAEGSFAEVGHLATTVDSQTAGDPALRG